MKMYEDTKFSQWQKKSIHTVNSSLKQNVLKVVELKKTSCKYQCIEIMTYGSIFKFKACQKILVLPYLWRSL